jgi:hypothetical protein
MRAFARVSEQEFLVLLVGIEYSHRSVINYLIVLTPEGIGALTPSESA